MIAQIENYPLGRVEVCPLNPRKRINPADIEEMAESILEHGILQPPIARPREARLMDEFAGPGVEIVFGQRRYLGAQRALELARERGMPEERIAELEVIPVIVRPMENRDVIEKAWIENLQRVDVSVREEAEGFAELLKLQDDDGQPLYTQATLAKKLGKSMAFLSQRLKLKHVPELMWAALEEKRISIRHLELVGTIADPKARERAAKAILDPKYRPEPLSTREAAKLIEEEYRKTLRGVAWDARDADLVPVKRDAEGNRISGGSCEDCPYRTGNVPELKGEVAAAVGGVLRGQKSGFDPRVCLQPACHRAKEEAHWQRLQAAAESGGQRILTKEEAKKTFPEYGSETMTAYDSALVVLAARPDYRATGHHGQDDLRPWEELLQGTEYEKDLVIGRHPKTGAVLRLIDRERAIKLAEVAMKERGEVSPFTDRPKPTKKSGHGGAEKEPQPLQEWEVNRQACETAGRAILLKVRELVTEQDGLSTELLRELVTGILLENLFEMDGGDVLIGLLERLGHTMPKREESSLALDLKESRFAIGEDLDGGKDKGKAQGTHVDAWLVILALLSCYEACESESGRAFLMRLGIDAQRLHEEARAQILEADQERLKRERAALAEKQAAKKAREAQEKAPAKKKAAKKPAATKNAEKAPETGKSKTKAKAKK